MQRKKNLVTISSIVLTLLVLLAACNAPTVVPSATQTELSPTQTLPTQIPATQILPTQVSATQTSAPSQITESGSMRLDLNGLAQIITSQIVPATSTSTDVPYWEILPQYELLTLEGYPISNHLMTAQIFIYPVAELAAANEGAGKIAADLQTLLQNQQVGKNLPFLPVYNAAQVMHAQVSFLNFKNGNGVRYLTQFDQAFLPINNHELLYTFQGLTSDGKYYVAAVLPVNLASLPANETVTGQEPPEFSSDFPKYLENVVNTLDQQPANTFTPDLSQLDALIQSIEIH